MNAHEKIHQALLQEWTIRIANQTASGLTIREWCMQNNLSIHKYNYWKHIIKKNVTDQMLPDIVPVSVPGKYSCLSIYSIYVDNERSREKPRKVEKKIPIENNQPTNPDLLAKYTLHCF